MRCTIALLLVVACSSSRPSMRPSPPSQSFDRAACLVKASVPPADVPIAVLYERNPWLIAVGSDFPTIAIWADGSVVFIRENGKNIEVLQASIDSDAARQLAERVAEDMRSAPEHASVSRWTDGPTVEIVVRDQDRWRVSDVYGLSRKGDAATEPDGEPADKAPPGFLAAYRELLAARPAQGSEFVPADVEVLLWGFENAANAPLPWPAQIPPPPAGIVPKDDGPGDPHSYSHVVAAKFRFDLRDLVRNADQANRPIGFNGHKWTVVPLWRFRGQAYIHAILRCS